MVGAFPDGGMALFEEAKRDSINDQYTYSLGANLSADGIAGGSVEIGLSVGKKAGEYSLDLCSYLQACQHLGGGGAGGAAVNASATNAAPSSGATFYAGVTGSGGAIGDANVSMMADIKDPTNIAASAGIGIGGGGFVGGLTCQSYSKCIIH